MPGPGEVARQSHGATMQASSHMPSVGLASNVVGVCVFVIIKSVCVCFSPKPQDYATRTAAQPTGLALGLLAGLLHGATMQASSLGPPVGLTSNGG